MNALNQIANSSSLNAAQRASVEHFLGYVLDDGHYEIKEASISHLYGTKGGEYYAMSLDAGLPDDEGTWAAVICRMHFHVFIGPRGGIVAKSAPKHRAQFKGRRALGAFYPADCTFSN
jgi:hypothetical protein